MFYTFKKEIMETREREMIIPDGRFLISYSQPLYVLQLKVVTKTVISVKYFKNSFVVTSVRSPIIETLLCADDNPQVHERLLCLAFTSIEEKI